MPFKLNPPRFRWKNLLRPNVVEPSRPDGVGILQRDYARIAVSRWRERCPRAISEVILELEEVVLAGYGCKRNHIGAACSGEGCDLRSYQTSTAIRRNRSQIQNWANDRAAPRKLTCALTP